MERMWKLSVVAVFALLVAVVSSGPSTAASVSGICDVCSWKKVATCAGFLEGPSFDRSGQLFMVNAMTGNIVRVENDQCVVIAQTPGPNGTKFHQDGRLFVADRSAGIVAIDTQTGTVTTIVDNYEGEHFKAPNDLIFDANGGLYFTDPSNSNAVNPVGRVYYLPPESGAKVQLHVSGLAYPNGIALSADGQRVYIAEFALNRIISAPTVNATNKLEPKFLFANLEGILGPDGLAVDSAGNVYAAQMGSGQVRIIDPKGFAIGVLHAPKDAGYFTTNLAFHGGYLYVTESTKNEVWRIKVKKTGLPLYGD